MGNRHVNVFLQIRAMGKSCKAFYSKFVGYNFNIYIYISQLYLKPFLEFCTKIVHLEKKSKI